MNDAKVKKGVTKEMKSNTEVWKKKRVLRQPKKGYLEIGAGKRT